MEKNSKNKIKRGTKSGKKKERRKYSSVALHRAVQAVAEGILSVRKAADTYGVPPTTLFRKFKNPEKLHCRSGPPTVLSEKEEAEIVNWIRYRSERGFPITKTDLLDSVQTYITCLKKNTPFIDNRPGRHWYEGFQKRHPDLSTRTAQHLVRASVTEEDLRGWFQEIGTYLTSKDLLNIHPSRVFNCDKTNIQLCPKPEKVLAKKGARSVYKVVDANEKESVTSLFMYNAEGTRAPPLIIYPYKKSVPKKVLENCPSGWGIGISESGRMTTETFYEYTANVFYPWLLKENIHFPIVLYLDGHSSHVTIPLVSFCREKKIELISLYPNATHIIQPLDVALFHPFKDLWRKTVSKWKLENNILRLKKEQFPAVLKIALDSFTEERKIIQSGFKTCGLMPFNPDAVEYYVLHKKKKTTSSEENNQPQEKENLTANQQFVSNTVYEDRDHYLQMFERTLRPELLQEFKNESTEIWTGSIEKKGLFEYWLEIKKRGHSTGIEKLENHKVRIIPKLVEDVPFEENMPSCNQQGIDSIVTVVKVENCLKQNYLENEHIVPLQISHGTSNIHFNNIQNSTLELDPNSLEFIDTTHSSSESNIKVLNSSQAESIFDANVNVSDNILQDNLQQKEISINNVVSTVNNEGTDVVEENKENETFFNKDSNNDNQSKIFANAFTLPHKYLPKKKKVKLEATGKAKLPSAGISDDWCGRRNLKRNNNKT